MHLLLLLQTATAEQPTLNGDFKQFFIIGLPYDHIFMPQSNYGLAYADGRVKIKWDINDNITIEGHHVITAGTEPPVTQLTAELEALGLEIEDDGGGLLMTGVGLSAPEAVELSWSPEEDQSLFLQGRTDRLYIKGSFGNVDVVLGRQAISFGRSLFFAPMDLVQPFSVATIDSEYKPGIDSLRVDTYIGFASQVTALVAYAGDWNLEGMIGVLNASTTIGLTDLSFFYGSVRGDQVVGAGVSTSLGSVGFTLESTLTFPHEDADEEDAFVRASLGALWKPFEKSTLTGEIYHQSLGAKDPDDYLKTAQSARFARGELWLMGRSYGALSWSQELTALTSANAAGFINIEDGSFMVSPSLSVSVSDNVQAAAGGYVGIGEQPDNIETEDLFMGASPTLKSEFGFVPTMLFLQLRSYF